VWLVGNGSGTSPSRDGTGRFGATAAAPSAEPRGFAARPRGGSAARRLFKKEPERVAVGSPGDTRRGASECHTAWWRTRMISRFAPIGPSELSNLINGDERLYIDSENNVL